MRSNSKDRSLWAVLLASALGFLALRIGGFNRATAKGQARANEEIDRGRDVQRKCAYQLKRGRSAEAPSHIPWTGWKDILRRTYNEIVEDRLLAVAAGVVFFALLAVFPAITALVSLYGLFADTHTIDQHLSLAAGILPQGVLDIVRDQIFRITSKENATLSLGFFVGLALALWSANSGMKAIIDALNVVYDEKEKRGLIGLNTTSLALTLAAIVSLLFAIAAVVVLPVVLNYLGLGGITEILLRVLRWPALLLMIVLGLTVLYRFAPSRTEPRWEWLSVGSVVAGVAWLIASALLSWYLANFANYNATYGSLGAAIGFMMWLWISAIVILMGAELNSEIEQ